MLSRASINERDLNVSYLAQGDRNSQPALLFLHGNVGSKSWWQPLFDILPYEMHLLAPDLRGCGSSTTESEDFSLPTLLDDLSRFVKALELNSVALIAHSTSCPLAIEFALKFGYILDCLVLVGCPPLTGIATPPEGYRFLQQAVRDQELAQELFNALLPHLDLEHEPSRKFRQKLIHEFQQTTPKALDGFTRILEQWDCSERINSLVAPLLLVRGEDDAVATHSTNVQTLLSIPGANNLEVIRSSGHAPMIENPSAFAVRLIDFIYQDFDHCA